MSHNYQTSFVSKGNLQISSVQATSHGKNAFVYMVIRTWNDTSRNEGCNVEHIFISSAKFINYRVLFEYVQKILKFVVVPSLLKTILYSLQPFKLVPGNWG